MKRFTFILLLLASFAIFGADWPAGPAKKHARLDVIIANRTSQDIDETGVYFAKHPCTGGIVGAGSSAGTLDWDQPVTTNAVVRWRDTRGVRKEQTIALLGVYDPKLAGALTFAIGETNVTVAFKKADR